MPNKEIALVTGANKGIGLQIATELAAIGLTVIIGARDPEKGAKAANSIEGDIHVVQLDVTDRTSVEAAAAYIGAEFDHLDVLVNNAGIVRPGSSSDPFPTDFSFNDLTKAPMDAVREVWETNVFGLITVTQAMLPLLRKSAAARIVNIGSTGGSLSWNSRPDNDHRKMFGTYSTSKSAAHAVSLAFAFALEEEGIKVNIACPGHTATALNNFSGARSIQEGAREAVRLAMVGPDGPTGTFSDEDGPVEW
ncbi:SDR family NAD(P)-dependent oxidoreductase [Stappia sp. BW2]|nr:SDR family NAD(P)-dependent oxidoreductase [Stappia sp. BW2]